MKKAVLGLLLVLAVIVVVSPGIIGGLAEQQIDENLNLAADHSHGVVLTSLGFDRGWFSSAGQHRLELGDGEIAAMLGLSGAVAGGSAPALIVDTRLDHGLIPVSSMRRAQGSLTPGLGNAVSTLALDLGDREPIDLPGAVYSKIGITGDLQANYVLPAGERSTPDGMVRWEPGQLAFYSDSNARHLVFSGAIAGSVTLPTGTVAAAISFDAPETELATFEWTDLLLTLTASIDIEVPAALVDLSLQVYPELRAAIGLGYLKKNGDAYTLKARLGQGLLTVNGAPMPLPLGAFR